MDGKIEGVRPVKRDLYSQALSHMDDKFILSITGPRRVGKTILIYQLIEECFRRGVAKERICYVSFDELITGEGGEVIEEILEVYRSRILTEKWKSLKEIVYIFLDEIQYVSHWQAVLKRFYDLRYKIKFIVTGSSSAAIKMGKESLAGRVFDLELSYLAFSEYLKIKGIDYGISLQLRDAAVMEDAYHRAMLHGEDLKQEFIQYLSGGGFPELLEIGGLKKKQEYVFNSVIEKVVFKDLPQVTGARDSRLLMDILLFAAANSGQLFEILQLSKNFKVSRETVSNYLEYLKKGFLIDIIGMYSPSTVKALRTNKKIYAKDTGIISSLLKYSENDIWRPDIAGKVIETYFINLCKNKYDNVFFWRDPYGHEVDIIAQTGGRLTVIETKYRAAVSAKEIKGVLYFIDKYGIDRAYVITPDTFEKTDMQGKMIFFLPAYFAAFMDFAL
jgi:predicted AAA+ superfamily ATPase